MKLSSEKKKDILIESFNVLKENYTKNDTHIQDIVGSMFSYDIETALEMWKYLLNANQHLVREYRQAYGLTGKIVHAAAETIGFEKVGEIIVQNELLLRSVFRESADAIFGTTEIIKIYLYSNKLETANILLDHIYNNKYFRGYTFGEYLEILINNLERSSQLTEEVINLLITWAEKIIDTDEKAKINVSLLRFL